MQETDCRHVKISAFFARKSHNEKRTDRIYVHYSEFLRIPKSHIIRLFGAEKRGRAISKIVQKVDFLIFALPKIEILPVFSSF